MWTSLGKLRALPDDTTVYCAHEYTAGQRRLSRSASIPRTATCSSMPTKSAQSAPTDIPTVPTSIGKEKRANPFLRADDPKLQAFVGHPGDVGRDLRRSARAQEQVLMTSERGRFEHSASSRIPKAAITRRPIASRRRMANAPRAPRSTTCSHAGERSHWHRVDATEIWHFYSGGSLELSLSPGTER